MNFGERVKAGLVQKIFGSKVCPKCGQLGYGIVKLRRAGNSKRVKVHFQHSYIDMDGKRKYTLCYLGLEGKRTVIKGCRRVERWICKCGYRTDSKWRLIKHVRRRHGLKVYEDVRKWIMENCKKKVKWVKKEAT